MNNIFLNDFFSRLRSWYDLRENLIEQKADLQTICVEVDRFWQWAPLSTHYLHPADVHAWPTPWELINDNTYCVFGRALGIIYTLMLLGVKEIDLVEATDYNSEDVVLVLVDSAKYVLNYHPNSVLNISHSQFKNIRKIDITELYNKIG